MKNMKKLAIIVSAMAVVLSGCSKGEYKTLAPSTYTGSTDTATTAADPLSGFTTVWAVEVNDPVLSVTHLRTLSNFLGFNTSHAAIIGSARYGFVSEIMNSGTHFHSLDRKNNYFVASKSYFETFPAPKDLGAVHYYKIRFAANVHENTRKIIPGDAYLDINITASSGTFNVKFADVRSPIQVTNDTLCTVSGTTVACDKVYAEFDDSCGDLIFKADVVNGELVNPVITFLNTAASYKDASCYSNGKLPNIALKNNNSIPSTLPINIHSEDANNDGTDDGVRGEIFKEKAAVPAEVIAVGSVSIELVPAQQAYSGIPSLIEQ